MADDTAALVLSLEARFDKFEKAMKDMTSAVDKNSKVIEDRFTAMAKVIETEMGRVAASMTSRLGVAGQVLSSLGPLGVGAAVGLGAVVAALNETANAAERAGQKAIAIRSFSLSTGFTLTEAQGIRKAFNAVGLDADKAETVIERFTLAMDQLRKTGTGPLRDGLEGVDTRIISLLLHTKELPDALRIVLTAMTRMTTESRNTLARGLGGRGGIDVFAEITGSLEQFLKAWEAGMAKAKSDKSIEAIAKQTKTIAVLMKEVQIEADKFLPTDAYLNAKQTQLEALLKVMREMNRPGFWSQVGEGFKKAFDAIKAGPQAFPEKPTKFDVGFETPRTFADMQKGIDAAFKLAEAKRKEQEASREAGQIAIETANTESEARRKTLADIEDKIMALERLQKVSGQAFSPQQVAELQKLVLQRAQLSIQGGPDLTGPRLAGEKAITDQLTAQQIALRERLGIATEEDILRGHMIDIEKQIRDGVIRTNEERLRAIDLAKKELKDRAEALQVRLSSTPGFTKLIQDSTNFAKITDTLAVSAVNHLTDAIFDAISGAKTFEEAFKAMAQVVLQEIAKMAIKFALLQSFKIATGGVTLPGMAEGGPVLQGSPVVVGESGPEVFMPSSSGFIVPNKALPSLGGGQNVNMGGFNIDARGAQAGVGDEILRKLRAEMPAIAVSSVSQAQRLGILRAQR